MDKFICNIGVGAISEIARGTFINVPATYSKLSQLLTLLAASKGSALGRFRGGRVHKHKRAFPLGGEGGLLCNLHLISFALLNSFSSKEKPLIKKAFATQMPTSIIHYSSFIIH